MTNLQTSPLDTPRPSLDHTAQSHVQCFSEVLLPRAPKKRPPYVMNGQFTKHSVSTNLFHGVLARHLGVICAKDGRFIFINKKVMAIFVRHVFKAKYMISIAI